MKIIAVLLFTAFNGYAQSVRCSYVVKTIGYSYDSMVGNYRETVTSIDRVKLCQGPETIAIGAKTTFHLGDAIEEVKSKKGKTFRLHATNEKYQPLILEMWYPDDAGAQMYVKATYSEYFIVYFLE